MRAPLATIITRGLLLVGLLTFLASAFSPPAAAADARFFSSTGYRINDDRFWDYFQKRGGVRTFGMPVSREFTLLGSKVQVFQRQVIQQQPGGLVGTLNILDAELMPYTKINGATLPAYDRSVVTGAPAAGSAGYDKAIVAFVKDRIPETWEGLPVNFWTTFSATVGLAEAFPNSDRTDPALLPLLALEMWGVPTSQPAYDPNNKGFVYLRFQRGVMMYDATSGLTQGVLLADYLKAILTGANLPADLDKDSKASRFSRQYNRGVTKSLNRPAALPNTDLTNAFEPEGSSNVPTPGTTATATPAMPTPATATPAPANESSVRNDAIEVGVQIDGADHGRLSIRLTGGETRAWTVPSLLLTNGKTISLGRDTNPAAATSKVVSVNEPGLGTGRQLEVTLPVREGRGSILLTATIFDGKPYATYRLATIGFPSTTRVQSFRLFDESTGVLDLASGSSYLVEDLDLQRGAIDSEKRSSEIQPGKPLLFNDNKSNRAYVLATLDPDPSSVRFSARSTGEGVRLGYEVLPPIDMQNGDTTSPRLFFNIENAGDPGLVLASYRKVVNSIYPSPKQPDWLRHQWTSSHAFGSDVNETAIRRQIDYLADNLSDIGGWTVVIDSGWYLADGNPNADGRRVDTSRFGDLRALVDYAHKKGVRVVLGVPGPYVDDRQAAGNRAGLRRLIDTNSAALIGLAQASNKGKYVYDVRDSAFREWWAGLLRDILVTYDADGIRIDGMGDAISAVRKEATRPAFDPAEFYRYTAEQAWAVKPNAYIEAGGFVPTFANPYVHSVRFADDSTVFDAAYPNAGLRQHLDYALYQRVATNQRPHLGDVFGDGIQYGTAYRWIEAGLAIGGQVAVSTDLTKLDKRTLSELRQRLALLDSFAGKTSYSFGTQAEAFTTTVDGRTFLGVINRSAAKKTIPIRLADFGLTSRGAIVRDITAATSFIADDVINAELAAGTIRLYVIRQDSGWIWASGSVSAETGTGYQRYLLNAPSGLDSFVEIAASRPARVLLDGRALAADGYSFNGDTGLLRVPFIGSGDTRELRIELDSTAPALRAR